MWAGVRVTWPGLWPGVKMHLDVEAGQAQPLAAGERVLGLVALERPEPGGTQRMMSASTGRSISGQYTGAPVARATRGDGADVVEVAVGDEDRVDLHAERLDRREQPLGLVAGIDDHGAPWRRRRRARCRRSPGPARR